MNMSCVNLPDITATERLGRLLAELLPPGSVVVLSGTLGAGKTRLVQAVAAACGIDPADVTSPTFVLCRQYEGIRNIYHLDAYRLKDEDEFLELGPEELFSSGALVFIEWGERVEALLPSDRLEIALEVTGESSRNATFKSGGAAGQAVVESIVREMEPASPGP